MNKENKTVQDVLDWIENSIAEGHVTKTEANHTICALKSLWVYSKSETAPTVDWVLQQDTSSVSRWGTALPRHSNTTLFSYLYKAKTITKRFVLWLEDPQYNPWKKPVPREPKQVKAVPIKTDSRTPSCFRAQLGSNAYLEVLLHADILQLPKQDRDFVFEIVNKIESYVRPAQKD